MMRIVNPSPEASVMGLWSLSEGTGKAILEGVSTILAAGGRSKSPGQGCSITFRKGEKNVKRFALLVLILAA